MRTFRDVEAEYGLKEFLDSPNGTLYFRPNAYTARITPVIVRKFYRDWPPTLVGPFVTLINVMANWIERHPELSQYVRVELPLEVGTDFVMRRHFRYVTSTRSYRDDEDPPDPPDELVAMRQVFGELAANARGEREKLIVRVLGHSIIEPNDKTYFEGDEGRFIIVDPKPNLSELVYWSELEKESVW